MIISHSYRYVFIELPRTGSTAISKELREYYHGERILHKHATYRDFLKCAKPDEARYFAFAGIRNPMDKLVSLYFKYQSDQRKYDDPKTNLGGNPFVRWLMRRQFRYVHEQGADFATFFRRFYLLPYDDWSSLDHGRMNFIIRFEHLADDFMEVLCRIGIKPRRPLPLVNKTTSREPDFWSYYTPDIQRRAQWVFGPYFRRWGYAFPKDWIPATQAGNELAFGATNIARRFYWMYIR